MSATPARDALITRYADAIFVDRILNDPPRVIAALVEAGWRPSDEELRAMGGTHSNEEPECVEWPTDLSTCAYYRRHEPGADPKGICSFGCREEPECQTCEPSEGWPRLRGEDPEPWRWVVDFPPGLQVERAWRFPRPEEAPWRHRRPRWRRTRSLARPSSSGRHRGGGRPWRVSCCPLSRWR